MALPREISNFFNEIAQGRELREVYSDKSIYDNAAARKLASELLHESKKGELSLFETVVKTVALNKSSSNIGICTAEFVATIPGGGIGNLRGTYPVVEELLRNSQAEVIAFGYEINDRDVIRLLHKCGFREVPIVLATDQERGTGKKLFEAWPADCQKPLIYEDVKHEDSALYSKMHSKLLLVDRQKLLLTSANFTFHGMTGNVEFGVALEGSAVSSLRDILISLLNSKEFQRMS